MSDLEAARWRPQTAAPMTAAATGKLQSVSWNQPTFSQANGLVDAFAEVFAHMTNASATPVESPVTAASSQDETFPENRSAAAPDDGEPPRRSTDETGTESTQLLSEVRQFDQAIDLERGEPIALLQQADDSEPATSRVLTARDAEVQQTEPAESGVDPSKALAPPRNSSDPEVRTVRHQQASSVAEPAGSGEEDQPRQDRTFATAPIASTDEEAKVKETSSPDEAGLNATAASRSHLRGRPRYRNEGADNHSPAESPAHPSGAQQRSPQASAESLPMDETQVARSGQPETIASSATTSKSVAPVAQLQGVTPAASRSAAPIRMQSGMRDPTLAIESLGATRKVAEAKPESRRANGSNKEMVSRIKLIQRVSKAFQQLGPEGGVVRLRLAPAEMGSIRLEMRIHQRQVQARVVAETEAASTSLREHLPDLRVRLESLGMQLDKIEIETDSQEAFQGSPFDTESRGHEQRPRHRQNHMETAGADAEGSESVSQDVSQSTPVKPAHWVSEGVDVQL